MAHSFHLDLILERCLKSEAYSYWITFINYVRTRMFKLKPTVDTFIGTYYMNVTQLVLAVPNTNAAHDLVVIQVSVK